MIKKTNNIDYNEKYKDFNRQQTIISELGVGDVVVLTINGIEQFSCTVLYGVSSHVNISLQDKGELATEQEKIQAQIDQLERQKLEV